MNSKNSKTSDPDRVLLNLSDKTDFKWSENMLLYQILASTIYGKNPKSYIKTINVKHQLQHGMKSLNHLKDHILHQIFKTTSSISSKNMKKRLIILQ